MTIIRILDHQIFDQVFLANYFHYQWLKGEFKKLCRRHVNQASVSTESLTALNIPYPQLEEQKAIARILAIVQEAIAGQDALIDKLKELKKSMMQYLFTYGTKDEKTKMTEIGEIPGSWDLVPACAYCPQLGMERMIHLRRLPVESIL